jgi:mannonate dehydratase
MKLAYLFFGHQPDEKWALARQMGIRYALAKLAPELTGLGGIWDLGVLAQCQEVFASQGFILHGLEGDQMDMSRIKLGLPGRDHDLDRYCQMVENLGQLGIGLLCYNFMATGWFRTHVDLPARGGALVSGFDWQVAKRQPNTSHGEVPAERVWENYAHFIDRVLPVAERAGVQMALHPDDPPVPILHGIGRIFTSAAATRRALALSNSPAHGLTFCQGTYRTMGENLTELVREFGPRIHFIHVRDVEGRAENFRETFHDNGPTDMAEMFRLYQAVGFRGAIRSDHVPTMAGEANHQSGYGSKGNLFGIGYLKGIMHALNIDHD